MVRNSRFVLALSLAGALLAAPAFADIPPADSCQQADAGKACDNATANGKMDLAGTCQKSKCTRTTPSGAMSYDCYLCKVSAAEEDDGGCSASGSREHAAFAAVPLLVLGLLWNRRRKGGVS